MKRSIQIALAAAAVFVVGACADLAVENPNAPDTKRALASPSDVEALVAGAYRTFYVNSVNYCQNCNLPANGSAGPILGTAANEWSCSWGNMGMRDYSSEPRIALNNTTSYTYRGAVGGAWYDTYRAIKGAVDGLTVINDGLKIEVQGVDNTARANAWGHFVIGISYGYLGNLYDKAFPFDETVDLQTETLEAQDYKEINKLAMDHLAKALDIASKNSFTIPTTYVNGVTMSNADFARVIHSYAARYIAQNARTPAERAAIDWNAVIAHADAGVTADWGPEGDAYTNWWNDLTWMSGDFTWGRMDLQAIGVADVSGEFQKWIAKTPAARTPFIINTPDRRIMGAGGVKTDGSYIKYTANIPFLSARGTYHFSNYSGHDLWGEQGDVGTGVLPGLDVDELRLLKAEGLLRKGDKAGAAALINVTRVANGKLPAVDANGTSGADCVPKLPNGNCGDLLEALKYEKYLEAWVVSPGGRFFDLRGWGDLVKNTPTQFPVPGKELQLLQLPYYTFGGEGGQSSAPGGAYGRPVSFMEFGGPSPVGLGSTISAKTFVQYIDAFSSEPKPTRRARGTM